jgi:pimeloyl-ACP methyl ester carboxylesterase
VSATVVLVHGAWHGGWCWEPVTQRLADRGVAAIAVDLPGHGADPGPLTDLHGHGDAVRSVLDGVAGPVVLVGHSYGGATVTDAGTHPSVRHVVYVTAFCLDAHESVIANDVPGGHGGELEGAIRFADDGTMTVEDAAAPAIFFGDCDEATAAAAVARLVPERADGFGQQPRAVAWRERPSTYAVCTDDRALTPALQRNLAARCGTVVEWPTSHSPFLSRPDLVADLLEALAETYAG